MEGGQPRDPRYPFYASVELIELDSDTRLHARTSDISLHGCYLDSMNPIPAGSRVRLKILHEGASFTALGTVIHSQPNMGMGISFSDIERNQMPILENWLKNLQRQDTGPTLDL